MIVAVVAERMVQVPRDEVVDMVSVRQGFVAATGAMVVVSVVGTTSMGRRAGSGVGCADRDGVLLDSIALRVVQMAVVEVVGVPVVLHGLMAAAGAVLVGVIGVRLVIGHGDLLLRNAALQTVCARGSGGHLRLRKQFADRKWLQRTIG